MSFNIFGPASKNSVRVGYISTDRGFVDNVTICEANDYAKLNPGTQFVFKTRNFIKYLNINEVNKLTPNDILSADNKCGGIVLDADCGYPEVYFYGGGGVGVQGNPVFGIDGSLLAVDLVHGGFGYQYPPIVEVKDNCGVGVGAVTRAILGEVVETVEYYDQEGDFEEYEICDPTDVGYGLRYGPNGEVLGNWDPTLYANLSKDPIAVEIKEYQDFLQKLQTPWWTTRTKNPLRVTSASRTTRTKHNVTDATFLEKQRKDGVKNPVGWSDFLNKYAISPVPPSNAPGSDFAGEVFTFEWEEEFPYTGEYVFRAQADNLGRFYLDNQKFLETAEFRQDQTPKKVTQTVKAGVHRIRIDLYNQPVIEKTVAPQTPTPVVSGAPFKIATSYTGVRDVPNNFNAGTYKITAVFKNLGNPGAIAIEIKNKASGKTVFNSLGNIGAATPKLLPITQLSKSGYDQLKNAAAFSDGFLIKNGVFPENLQAFSTTTIEWNNIVFNESGDYQISVCVDDSVDITVALVSSPPSAAPTPPTPKSQPSIQTTGSQSRKVFNTIDYINKANRRLWRTNVYGRGGFINEYGVCPFDTTVQLEDNPYAGTHTIVWDNISFPTDGNYTIEIEVDDNVTLTFSGQSGETVITKRGFSVGDRSTGKSTETKFFKAGTYKLTADLEQIPGGKFGFSNIKGVNPMALAVNIETAATASPVVSPKSWNENPMGVTLTIDAPLPPIPQEPIVQQEGRCPNNPIWTTRFPNAKQKWWPVKGVPGFPWSPFMNRYAISPIPPLAKKGTDGGGIVYRNEWELDIPYDGFYALKSTVDNAGRILIDGKPIMQANYIPIELKNTKGGSGSKQISGIEAIDGGKIYNWRENNPKAKKVFLTKGRHNIQIEVENGITETYELIDQKIFNTADWAVASTVKPVTVQQTVTENVEEYELVDDIYYGTTTPGPKVVGQRPSGMRGAAFIPVTAPANATFFSNGYGPWYLGTKLNIRDQVGGSGNQAAPDWGLDTDPYKKYHQWDENTRLTLGKFKGDEWGIKVWKRKAVLAKTSTITKTETAVTGGIVGGTAKDGVTYSGPTLATYVSGALGPFLTPAFKDDDDYRANNMGRSWISRWSNVEFPEDGQYDLRAEADDEVIVRIDGVEVGRAKVFEGVRTFAFNTTKGKRTVEMEFRNIPGNATSTFKTNPVVFNAIITKKVNKATGISKSWVKNPMGISAILIPPPCPKRVKGKGVVTEVIVDDPGNGFPRPGTGGYPVALRLKNVVVEDPGINYSCGIDQIQITPSNGAVLDYECDTFGRIINVKVLNPGLGFTNYPDITLPSDTGINATFRPQFEVVRDPIVTEPQKLIQVTDLVGLKQTGYVDGRPYYGAVFSKDGINYAGFYETPGDLVQVYATLQESIDAQVTTAPSAIQRQGTDVTSNDPRLNLPGTPENLI